MDWWGNEKYGKGSVWCITACLGAGSIENSLEYWRRFDMVHPRACLVAFLLFVFLLFYDAQQVPLVPIFTFSLVVQKPTFIG